MLHRNVPEQRLSIENSSFVEPKAARQRGAERATIVKSHMYASKNPCHTGLC